MRLIQLVALSCCLLAFAPLARAADSVEQRLNARGLKFTKDSDGDYRAVYRYADENRTQVVYVSGATESTNGLVIREVFSPAGNTDTDSIDGEKALELLGDARNSKIGAWELEGKALVYVVKLPDNVDAATLEAAMDVAATKADNMEIKLSGAKDAF